MYIMPAVMAYCLARSIIFVALARSARFILPIRILVLEMLGGAAK